MKVIKKPKIFTTLGQLFPNIFPMMGKFTGISQFGNPNFFLCIIESGKIKNKLYKKYLSTKDVYFLTKYQFYRNKISNLLRISKQQYYQNYFLENNKNIKNIWSGIKELITLKPKGLSIPSKIVSNNNSTLEYPKAIACAFNNYFANIG